MYAYDFDDYIKKMEADALASIYLTNGGRADAPEDELHDYFKDCTSDVPLSFDDFLDALDRMEPPEDEQEETDP